MITTWMHGWTRLFLIYGLTAVGLWLGYRFEGTEGDGILRTAVVGLPTMLVAVIVWPIGSEAWAPLGASSGRRSRRCIVWSTISALV
jgi:hypothetical protein